MRHDSNIMLAFVFQQLPKSDLFSFVHFFVRLKSLVEEASNSFSTLEAKRKESETIEEQKKEAFLRFPYYPFLRDIYEFYTT